MNDIWRQCLPALAGQLLLEGGAENLIFSAPPFNSGPGCKGRAGTDDRALRCSLRVQYCPSIVGKVGKAKIIVSKKKKEKS